MKKCSLIIAVLFVFASFFGVVPMAVADDPPKDTEALNEPENEPVTEAVAQNDVMVAKNETLEEEKARLFLKAFGQEVPSTFYDHDVLVQLDQQFGTYMVVEMNPYTQALRFNTEDLVPFLEQYLLPLPLKVALGQELPSTLNEDFLRERGFEVVLRAKEQTVQITTPLDLRKNVPLFLSGRPKLSIAPAEGSSEVSGYVNMSHSLTEVQYPENIPIASYNGQYSMNMNFDDWLFQSELSSTLGTTQMATISGYRMVKDSVDDQVRYTVGHTRSPNASLSLSRQPIAAGFQKALLGVNAIHVTQFNPNNRRNNDFMYVLLVEEDSLAKIEINGRSVFTGRLLSGKYEVQNFPFQAGRNEIVIQMNGDRGWFETVELEHFHNPSLLQKGQKEYQFATGAPYQDNDSQRPYAVDQWTNLLYWRHGVSEQFTGTSYLQTVPGSYVGGVIGEYGFGSGITNLEVARSRNLGNRSGTSMRMQVSSANTNVRMQAIPLIPSFYTLSLNYTSKYFDPSLLNTGPAVNNDTRWTISPVCAWQFTSSWQLQMSTSFQRNVSSKHTQSISIRTNYRMKRLQWTASFSKETDRNDDNWSINGNVTWRPKARPRDRYNYRYNTVSKGHQMMASIRPTNNRALNYQFNSEVVNPASYSFSPTVRYQMQNSTLTTGMNYAVNGTNYNGGLNLAYNGPRTILQTNYTQSTGGESTKSLRVDSALAFVGDRWGVSTPISNSFALLYANNEEMTDSTIVFSNGSILDRLSHAVYPILPNYQTQSIEIDMADVPVGLDLGAQKYVMQGRLNSGEAIPVGKPGGILMASMILLKPNGKPYELEVGTMVSIEDPQLTVQFFTNRQGKLFVQGLRAGEYRVELLGDTFANFTITVPKSKEILIDLGRVTLEPNTE